MPLLDSWTPGQHTAGDTTHPTYRKGSGPGVVVIHEIPGLTPKVIGFAEELVAAGYTVVLPHLFGTPEAELTHKVDVGPYVAVKRASIRCHASQITDAGFFSTMPDDAFAMAFGTEWYIERDGSPPVRDGWLFE